MENEKVIKSDEPLENPGRDKLGYASAAENLAVNLSKKIPQDGMVTAIYGEWGSGKTTFLNFVLFHLRKEENNPLIIRFNPWLFSNQSDLISKFLEKLTDHLKEESEFYKVSKKISNFADTLSETNLPYTGTAKILSQIFPSNNENLLELKNEIEDLLENSDKQIYIVVDDMDRLISKKIVEIFRMIKAVADFPNVTYLLAFDQGVVKKSLEGVQNKVDGRDFLEKIVQLPIELPSPEKPLLRNYLVEEISKTIGEIPDELYDEQHWQNILLDGVEPLIRTPRDANRFVNSLRIDYEPIKSEVNPFDFIGLESIRVFFSSVYKRIRSNKKMFAGPSPSGGKSQSRFERLKEYHIWFEEFESQQKEYLRNLLIRLFPKLRNILGEGGSYGSDWSETWFNKKRICSTEIFDNYFRMAIPEGEVSFEELNQIFSLNKTNMQDAIVRMIEISRPDDRTKTSAFLEKLNMYDKDSLEIDQLKNLLEVLINIGDQLIIPKDTIPGIIPSDNYTKLNRIILEIVNALPEENKYEILKDSIEAANSVSIPCRILEIYGKQHGKFRAEKEKPEEERVFGENQIDELSDLIHEKIYQLTEDDSLLEKPKFFSMLAVWKEVNRNEVDDYISDIVRGGDNHELANFLKKFVGPTYSTGFSDKGVIQDKKFSMSSLEKYVDVPMLYNRLKGNLEEMELSEEQREAIELFLEKCKEKYD